MIGSQSGTFVAYCVETKGRNEIKWTPIDLCRTDHGVPFPVLHAGILIQTYSLGYEQAMAIAWGLAAKYDATFDSPKSIRVRPMQVRYSVAEGDKKYEPIEIGCSLERGHLVEKTDARESEDR